MDIVKWFGEKVTRSASTSPNRARKLLLAGYRANMLTFKRPIASKQLSRGRLFAAKSVMKVTINALSKPENASLVSLFTPCEPLLAAGITPYSLETISGYLMGTQCETHFQELSIENGIPDTMCSFHKTFLGASDNGILPKPKFIVYTSLACDGNMITFPYLRDKFQVPCFFIDVPYEKSQDSVLYVADQLKSMKTFIQDVSGKYISEDSIKQAVKYSRMCSEDYINYLKSTRKHRLPASATDEMYAAFMSHILLGSKESQKYFSLIKDEIERAKESNAKRLIWIHAIPYSQPSLKNILNFSDKAFITACDLCYDSLFVPQDENNPYVSMAKRLVYSGYNGDPYKRIENAINAARLTNADGAIIFAHWGCKTTLGATQIMKTELEKEGIPTLVLDGDACCPANTGDGQISTRLQAFLEMLENNI